MQAAVRESVERLERAREVAQSKQPRFSKTPKSTDFFASVLHWVDQSKDIEPEYQSDSRKRDKWLANFWTEEPHWAGVISQANMIDSNRGWTLTGGRNQVLRFIPVLRDADDGGGWRQYCSQQSQGFYVTDIGAITEIGRDGVGGPMRSIYHLDPTLCYLTGDRDFPLHYDNNTADWARDDYFRLVSMKNIQERFRGLGFCATSRVLDMCKIMLAVYNHELEMLGSRAPKGLMLLQNVSQGQWEEAMKVRDAKLDSDMRKYYNAVAVIAQEGVDSIDAKLVALSQLPEGFNLEMFTNLLMYAYSLCIGYDPIEFWPVQAGQLGRGRETDIQHRKGTGKGGLNFMLAMQEAIQAELPETLHFAFEQRDAEGEKQDAEVAQAWADVVMTLRGKQRSTTPGPNQPDGDGTTTLDGSSSVISVDEARMLLVMHNVIPDSWTTTMEEATATDVKEIEKERQREMLLNNDAVRRAAYQFPMEPIIRYSWISGQPGKTEILYAQAQDILRATRYTVVKPEYLLPDFSESEEESEIIDSEPVVVVEQEINRDVNFSENQLEIVEPEKEKIFLGWTIQQGTGDRLEVTVRDKNRREIPVDRSQKINFYLFDEKGIPVLSKELGQGVEVSGATIGVDILPSETANLSGTYSCAIRIRDDFGRTFSAFKDQVTVLKEMVDA